MMPENHSLFLFNHHHQHLEPFFGLDSMRYALRHDNELSALESVRLSSDNDLGNPV